MMRAAELADRIGASWPVVLEQLGIPAEHLVNRHGPCPACGGKDRYRFDNKHNRGNFFCNACGPGDGYQLLMRVHGWDFRTARDRVADAAGLSASASVTPIRPDTCPAHGTGMRAPPSVCSIAQPTSRVVSLWRQRCAPVDCDGAVEYLANRRCWPLPPACALRAHPSVEYFVGARRIGRYTALLAGVLDLAGELVTVHVTYLERGRKLTGQEPRKLLSPLTGHTGCAVRLMPLDGEVLGIAEGIETALSAAKIHRVPTWAALNAALLARFEPPAGIKRVVIFADRDTAGLEAAAALMQRLQGRVEFEMQLPPAPAKDWNDATQERQP
jgi:putative DNA primase/helicase